MDNKLAASLSEEEAEILVQNNSNVSPPRPSRKAEGYKFNVDQNLTSKDKFNFASKSKQIPAVDENSSSEVDEAFEVLNPEDANGTDSNSVPTTPTKVTPHKRTAVLAPVKHAINGSDGSPPSSPAPKKRKEWNDYVKEDEEKRKLEKERPKHGTEERGFLRLNLASIAAVVILVAAILFAVYSQGLFRNHGDPAKNASAPSYTWKKAHVSFFKRMNDLKAEFPHQNKETWIALIASISSTLNKTEPVHPAAITVLFPPNLSQDFVTCFLGKVGQILNEVVAPLLENGKQKPAEVKTITRSSITSASSITDFRADIKNYLKNHGKAVVATDIDGYRSQDELLQFHGLCDNFHAVDKRGTFLFPVRVPENILRQFEWVHARGGEISNAVLTEAWKSTLSIDSAPALVARVTDTVILLNEGDKCSS